MLDFSGCSSVHGCFYIFTCWNCNLKVYKEGLLAFLAFLTVLLMSMAGVNFTIALFAALQFCNLMCESAVLAQIYCPPILLCRPRSALCPSSLRCKYLLPAPHSSHFSTFSLLLLLLFFSLCSTFQLFYPLFFTRVPEKAKTDSAV